MLFVSCSAAARAATTVEPRFAVQFSRIDTLAQYSAQSAWCERLGYRVDSDRMAEVELSVVAEAAAAGLDQTVGRQIVTERSDAWVRILAAEMKTLKPVMVNGGARPAVEAFLGRYARRCAEAAADPSFSQILTPPSDLAAARRSAVEDFLEVGGQAAWQTPAVKARGELLFAVGSCRLHLSAAEVEAETAGLANATDKVGVYYNKWYMDGLGAAEELGLNEVQCNRVLQKRRPAATPVRSRPAVRKPLATSSR